MSLEVGIIGGIVEALAPVADPEVIAEAVNDYLEDHPEATCPIDDTAGEGDTGKVWSADKTATEVEGLKEAIEKINTPVEYKFSGTDILIGFGFSATLDYVIVMNNGRANGLFDFAKLCTKAKGTSLEDLATADLTTVWNTGTDMHSPFQFLAVNNADGYHADAQSASFTGGNHTLDSLGTGFETASSVYVHFYADGTPVSSGHGKCSSFEIRWANDVQAYNTVKQGGGGRACLREYHDMVFDGVTFKEKITLKALEAIKLSWYNGIQCVSIGTTYENVAFVDATNRGTFASSENNISSGNAVTSGLIAWGDDHQIEMYVDTGIDLGKRTYYSGTDGAYAAPSYGKGYFSIIGQTVNASAGDKFYLDGAYRFVPPSYETEQPTPTPVQIVAAKNGLIQAGVLANSLCDYATLANTTNQRFISVGATGDGYPAIGSIDTGDFAAIYPYPIPSGAKTITVAKQGLAPLIVYYNSTEKSTDSYQRARDSAKVLNGETAVGGTPWSISAWTYNSRTFTIPDTAGIDSFTLGFYTNSASDYANFDPSDPGITITFGFD